MSCSIYPSISQDSIADLKQISRKNELEWLIAHIIKPELPSISEALSDCLKYLKEEVPNTLPLSSSKSETLKGIIVRSGCYITKLEFVLKIKGINKFQPIRIKSNEKILLTQIIESVNSIEKAIDILDEVIRAQENDDILKKLEELLNEIKFAKLILKTPNSNLLFPIHCFTPKMFDPELTENISLDLYITNSDLALEIKSLEEIDEKPWCEIDSNGQSYVDNIRENLKNDRHMSINDIIKEKDEAMLLNNENSNYLNSFLKSFKKYQPIDYITKCITYQNSVVMVLDKTEVTSPDPKILLTSTKLDSLQHVVANLNTNLKHVS